MPVLVTDCAETVASVHAQRDDGVVDVFLLCDILVDVVFGCPRHLNG